MLVLVTCTHKLLRTRELEELDEAEVVSARQVQAGVGNAHTVHVGLVGVTGPNAEDLVAKDAEKDNRSEELQHADPKAPPTFRPSGASARHLDGSNHILEPRSRPGVGNL